MRNSQLKFKNFKFDAFNNDTGEVEGYASKFNNIDQVGDIVEPGAFTKSIANGASSIRFLWQHDRKVPIGIITDLKEDAKGLRFKARFANTQAAQETRELMKMGAMDSFSIGYIPVIEQPDEVSGRRVTRLKEIRLLEVSAVTFPANAEAKLNSIKSDLDDMFGDLTLEQQVLAKAVLETVIEKMLIIRGPEPEPEPKPEPEPEVEEQEEAEEAVEEAEEPTETSDDGDAAEKAQADADEALMQIKQLEEKLAAMRLETALRKATKR